MVERLVYTEDVGSSSLSSPTISPKDLNITPDTEVVRVCFRYAISPRVFGIIAPCPYCGR
ncbi:hypothetical protein AGR7B_Cc50223 [Agrobacterium deltaense RV3]|nr:hypothetical protein AGR7B_Cc50223 [Agrobacterium deltaense RV3]